MAILDDVLAGLVHDLKSDLSEAGLTRQRGGIARGVAWAEASGRVSSFVTSLTYLDTEGKSPWR